MGTSRGEHGEPRSTTIGGVKQGGLNKPVKTAVQQLPRGKQVTARNSKLMGRGLRTQPWLKALIKLAVKCRAAFLGKAHDRKGDLGGWEGDDSLLLRVCTNAKQIESAIVSGNVKGVYALAGKGFIRHREEAINALRGDSHTASVPSP